MIWHSELWIRVRAALLAPSAEAAAVTDIDAGLRLPLRALLPKVLELQAHVNKWLEEAGCAQRLSVEAGRLHTGSSYSTLAASVTVGANTGGKDKPPLVAIFCHQSADYICMALSVLAAGAAFLPLDPAWPDPRVALVLQLARPCLLLTTPAHRHLLPAAVPASCSVHVVTPAAPVH
ncbi:hypothetical protein Agub_g4996, partial [Astrephomene gubernaculifera]